MSTNTLAKQCRGSLCTAVNALKKQIKRQQETINELTRNQDGISLKKAWKVTLWSSFI